MLFVGSGCAAMVYEVAWLQMLQLVIGSSAVSLGVLLGTFMGGMGAGSLLLPRLVSVRRNPLRVYAMLELGIGATGLMILLGLPAVELAYVSFVGRGMPEILLRGGVAGVCLLVPTMLMGATLPAIARRVETTPEGVTWLGLFYGGNIAGAVFGCLLAGFYLLRVFDTAVATYVALAINVTVAGIALALSSVSALDDAMAEIAPPVEAPETAAGWGVYLAIGLSGMSALGAEVIWTRLLSLMLGATVYTFSLILAVFLIGLGIGSSYGAFLAARVKSPRRALGVCQWLLTAAIAWTALMIAESLPYWPVLNDLSSSPWYTFQLDLARCLWAILPPACLWGASFPLALAAAARGQDPGRLVGGVYAANTIGAVVGALVFSLVLIPAIGTGTSEKVLIGIAALASLVIFMPLLVSVRGARRVGGASAVALALVASGFLAWRVTPMPWEVVAFGRQTISLLPQSAPGIVKEEDVPTKPGEPDVYCTYVGEGANVSVAVTKTRDGVRSFHGAGKVQASTQPADMRLQRMLGHIPALVHKKPESVLVVACGAGVTAGSFVVHPDVKRIVICDIEPLVPKVVTPMFGEQNYHVVDGIARENPHTVNGKEVEVVYDDGRHYLRTTREKFDVITSDPIDPWVKGCAALNTVEYYQMCRDHLNPGGIVSLWIPLYESNLETSKSVISTFFHVFPNALLFSNDRETFGYDAILFGQVEPTVIDLDAFQARINRPDHARVKESLHEVGFGEDPEYPIEEGIDLLSTYAGQAALLKAWSRGAQLNTDRNLRLQYLAGLWLNTNTGEAALGSIREHYRFPEKTFVGSAERVHALKALRFRPIRWR